MSRRALVLNQDMRPVAVCSVYRAFLLVFLEKAELISVVQDKQLRTVNRAFPMPSIIQLVRYVRIPYKGMVLTRQNIFKRDGYRCQYCGAIDNLTLDHVIPKSRGGSSTWDNLVTACKTCNSKKGDYTPDELSMTLLQKPFKPSFSMFLQNFSDELYQDWLPFLQSKSKI